MGLGYHAQQTPLEARVLHPTTVLVTTRRDADQTARAAVALPGPSLGPLSPLPPSPHQVPSPSLVRSRGPRRLPAPPRAKEMPTPAILHRANGLLPPSTTGPRAAPPTPWQPLPRPRPRTQGLHPSPPPPRAALMLTLRWTTRTAQPPRRLGPSRTTARSSSSDAKRPRMPPLRRMTTAALQGGATPSPCSRPTRKTPSTLTSAPRKSPTHLGPARPGPPRPPSSTRYATSRNR